MREWVHLARCGDKWTNCIETLHKRKPELISGCWIKPDSNRRSERMLQLQTNFKNHPIGLQSNIPSGKHTKNYWKWPFIVSFPIKWWLSIVFCMFTRGYMIHSNEVSLWLVVSTPLQNRTLAENDHQCRRRHHHHHHHDVHSHRHSQRHQSLLSLSHSFHYMLLDCFFTSFHFVFILFHFISTCTCPQDHDHEILDVR